MIHTREEQMEAFGRFLDILDELRVKCPWDRKQTNESLRPNTMKRKRQYRLSKPQMILKAKKNFDISMEP